MLTVRELSKRIDALSKKIDPPQVYLCCISPVQFGEAEYKTEAEAGEAFQISKGVRDIDTIIIFIDPPEDISAAIIGYNLI